ncbi:SGNH hydrolase domain-containing protein [Demequina sediminis]|uniref:SGNH hydrolase domain-containing protein n=1 Tax=Demequina sediminis TaxID=1930058 RepID=UPI0025746969|nr:SGNH hydrolase domain-containing protein [Demequina sediminis]
MLRDAAEQARDARVVDLTPAYCADGQCSPVIGSVIVYRPDGHHVSATYAATVAPFLERGIEAALAGRDATAQAAQ